jgi:hypothetical protein
MRKLYEYAETTAVPIGSSLNHCAVDSQSVRSYVVTHHLITCRWIATLRFYMALYRNHDCDLTFLHGALPQPPPNHQTRNSTTQCIPRQAANPPTHNIPRRHVATHIDKPPPHPDIDIDTPTASPSPRTRSVTATAPRAKPAAAQERKRKPL